MKYLAAGVLALALAAAANAAPGARKISAQGEFPGEITPATPLDHSDGSRSQRFVLPLAAGQMVSLKMDGALDGTITVFRNGRLVARASAGDNGIARLALRADRADRYLVAINGADAHAFGPFRLSVEPVPAYSGEPLTAGARITDWLVGGPQSYALQVDEPGLFTLSMESDELDARLHLSGNGTELYEDNGGDNTDARLKVPLQPGRYSLTASPHSDDSGFFDLAVQRDPLPAGLALEDGTELPLPGTVHGFLEAEGLRYFVLAVPERQRVWLRGSSELDTSLRLEGEGIVLDDADSGGDFDPLLSAVLEPGRYNVRVTTLGSRNGLFQLTSRAAPASDGGRPVLKPGREHSAILQPGIRDLYTLDIPRKGRYLIGMSSSSIAGLVTLMRDGVQLGFKDDNDEVPAPARELELELEAGSYVLAAYSFDPAATGNYRLLVQRQ